MPKISCRCGCGRMVSPRTENRHRTGKAAPQSIKITRAARISSDSTSFPSTSHSLRQDTRNKCSSSSRGVPAPRHGGQNNNDRRHHQGSLNDAMAPDALGADLDRVLGGDVEISEPADVLAEADAHLDNDSDHAIREAVVSAQSAIRPRRARVDDYESDTDEEDTGSNGYISDSSDSDLGEDEDDIDVDGLSASDRINEDFEREIAEFAEELSDDDIALLRHFALKTESHMTDATFEKLQYAFPESTMSSLKLTKARVAFLSAFKPVPYDCCINACCCFVGPHATEKECTYCHEPRYNAEGKPRKRFTYVPIIPRLVNFYKNPESVERMKYRGEFVHEPGTVKDVFDSQNYRTLSGRHVELNGKVLAHRYFQHIRDIALGLSTDGFAPWRRRKHTCWPLLLFNYNLPPEIRFLIANVLCVGVIPGPKKPKDFDSFLWPLVEELLELLVGVRAFDVTNSELFSLRAYLVLVFGDIPAVSMVMRMKGHNGFCPCRMCKITGLGVPNSRSTTLYAPLDRSRHPQVLRDPTAITKYDPSNLPLRTHIEFLEQAREVQSATTDADEKKLSRQYGIKGIPLLSYLPSLFFPSSFPYDFMHLIYENLIKNLVLLWTGNFKGLDEGSESYQLQPKVWEAIGAATAASGSTIPLAFGARPPNVADDKSAGTADTWSFWLLYLGPVLLSRKFSKPIYFQHFVQLVKLINICLQFEITTAEIVHLREGFQSWVETYERLYYQYSPDRLSACPITVHALLHIADSIEISGPVWASWAFPMERFCGLLQPAIKSRRFPYACIDNYIVATSQLAQIKIRYGLGEVLSLKPRKNDILRGSYAHPDYPTCVLLPPRRPSSTIPPSLANKIIIHLATRFSKSQNIIRRHFSIATAEQWARVRRLEGGDDMYASSLITAAEDRRDPTFVRYDMLVDIHANRANRRSVFEKKSFFGQLQNIVVVHLPATPDLDLAQPTTLILASILSCNIDATNTLDMHFYSRHGPLEVVDIACVQCLVARLKTLTPGGREWAVIDRSGNLGCSYYNPEDQ